MKKLAIIYNRQFGQDQLGVIDQKATLQALCDAVNELQEESCPCGQKRPHTHDTGTTIKDGGAAGCNGWQEMPYMPGMATPKRFKAGQLKIQSWADGGNFIEGFTSEAEAQAALKLLLNL